MATVEPIQVSAPIAIGSRATAMSSIRVEPADHLIIDYTLDYPAPIGVQKRAFRVGPPARPMCRKLRRRGPSAFVDEFTRCRRWDWRAAGGWIM